MNHRVHGATALPYDHVAELKPVIIRDYVYIGAGAMILPGVEIGEGAVIGMGAVVTKDVPPLAIVMGNPAQIVYHRDPEEFRRLKESKSVCRPGMCNYEERLTRASRRRHARELQDLGLM
jgi:maltose O-acetyltransferase